MNNLLNPEGPVMSLITKIAYSVWLNVLWFICCIPIITIGPSTTALFYVTQKMVVDEEGRLTASFFRSFRENFRQSTIVGLILTVLAVFFAVDGYVFYHIHSENAFWTILTAIYLVALAAYVIVCMYIYPLMAHFENTILAMFKNAIVVGLRFLYCTFFMAVVYFAMAVIIVRIFTPAIIFGMGSCALVNSWILQRLMVQLEPADESEEEEALDEEAAFLAIEEEIRGGKS